LCGLETTPGRGFFVGAWHAARLGGAARRKPIRLKIGRPYYVNIPADAKIPNDRMSRLTEDMMLQIAELLPAQYWGFYRERMLGMAAPDSHDQAP